VKITCPLCRHERDANLKPYPPRSVNVTCPKCKQRFTMDIGKSDGHPAGPSTTDNNSEAAPATPKATPVPQPAAAGPAPAPPRPEATVIPATPPPAWVTHKVGYKGKGGALFGIYIMNTLLTVLTLGIYSSWGKVKVRKYLCGATELMGERFTYTGTGRELFNGRIKAVGIMFIAFGIPNLLARFVHPALGALAGLTMMVVIPLAMVSSRRYRLSRTMWHGVRFSFAGSAKEYIKLYNKGSILTMLTLGLYGPYFHAQRETFWRNNSRYGSGSFKYTGVALDLKKDFLKAWLLTIPTLGFCWFWYSAKRTRYDWEKTSFGGLTFTSNVTGRGLLSFHALNALIMVLTLGFGMPFIAARNIKFISDHLTMKGNVEFEKLEQVAPQARAVGDGLVDMLDIDMGM
jgi:uncharacterized membrane protein YjgN (DUF898 family)